MATTISPKQFVAKWSKIQQKETAVSQSHFNDICHLIGHPVPLEFDPEGKRFSFETQTDKPDGRKGFADVYFQGRFIWEYKGPHRDLNKAYQQLQLYRESLQNPPLLITSDIHTIIIHTNFNNYPTQKHEIGFDDIIAGEGVEKLRWAFFSPDKFKPEKTQEQITKATADTFLQVAEAIKQHRQTVGESYTTEQIAHLMARLLFCLFAEDLRLLPNQIFTKMVQAQGESYADFHFGLRNLFREMRTGGTFGFYRIRHFDGTLFDDDFVPELPADLGNKLMRAAQQDWSAVDPSIFGTLFERVIDEGKRAQLGAHYTSEADIMLIVEPVLMTPLRQKWDAVRRQANVQPSGGLLADFAAEIAAVRVLDPACGSGNFLYVALRELLGLQKEVIAYAARKGLPPIELTVSPEQLYGIEINPYAHELAQITAWIGYLQWRQENGFGEMDDPVLRPLHNIKRMDAILAYDADGNPVEPKWPAADVIIGNPPFLGNFKMRSELGDKYVEDIYGLYGGQVLNKSDLVCYWFELARQGIEESRIGRAGLIATNSIRGGANRRVLDNIKITGDIFLAWSDNPWILDGAAVRVSLIGFGNKNEKTKLLDGKVVHTINSNLTSSTDISKAKRLEENAGLSYEGIKPAGDFVVPENIAVLWINKNQNNQAVLKPYINGSDISRKPRNAWLIDFHNLNSVESSQFNEPFGHVLKNVRPKREKNRDSFSKQNWWLHQRARPELRGALTKVTRYICSPRVSKHRVFIWLNVDTLPDSATTSIVRESDYFFGVLHSRLHEVWALRLGTSLEDRPRYTPTTTFETFPFPWPPGQEPPEEEDERVAAIGRWARALVAWRQAWLYPPRTGLYAGLGDAYEKMVKKRTLTNLYNGLVYYRQTIRRGGARTAPAEMWDQAEFDKVTRKSVTRADIQELDDIHAALDTAVLDAYGWPHNLSDEQILEHLLVLNLERAANQNR